MHVHFSGHTTLPLMPHGWDTHTLSSSRGALLTPVPPLVNEPWTPVFAENFSGIYCSLLPLGCWSADSQRVVFDSAQRSRQVTRIAQAPDVSGPFTTCFCPAHTSGTGCSRMVSCGERTVPSCRLGAGTQARLLWSVVSVVLMLTERESRGIHHLTQGHPASCEGAGIGTPALRLCPATLNSHCHICS